MDDSSSSISNPATRVYGNVAAIRFGELLPVPGTDASITLA